MVIRIPRTCAALGPIVLAGGVAAGAQAPPDAVTWQGTDTVAIRSTVQAPDACYSAGPALGGAPAGATPVANAVAVTFTLQRAGADLCAQVITPVAFAITTKVPPGSQAILVYVVNPTAKTTSVRAVALPPRPGGEAGPQPPPLQGTGWLLSEIGGTPVEAGDMQRPASLTLLASEPARFTGSTGCNSMGGPYTLDGAALRLGPAVATRMACPRGAAIETAFLAAIERVRAWRITGRTLDLLDDTGAVLARLGAIAIRPPGGGGPAYDDYR
jgi:heat shock protein HslJ